MSDAQYVKLSRTSLTTRYPLFDTLLLWLFLDRVHAPAWVFGSLGMLMLIVWIGTVIMEYRERGGITVDIASIDERIRVLEKAVHLPPDVRSVYEEIVRNEMAARVRQ